MSWGAYITGEGGLLAQYDKIACGGIFGQNGSTFAQAQLDHVQTNYTEIIDMVNLMNDPTPGYEKGFTFNQFPFALLRVDEGKILHAKGKGEGAMFPMTIQKTNQALVIAIGTADAVAGQVSSSVAKIADYLDGIGY
jgi:hypothetical protein